MACTLGDNDVWEKSIESSSFLRRPINGRHTFLTSSCKLFCMIARARMYMETSKLPIVPKGKIGKFCDLARDSVQTFLLIYKTFDQEDDLRHLNYFITGSRSSTFSPLRFSMSPVIVQACWQEIREFYPVLYPGDLDWYPLTEVSRQIVVLEGTLRVTPTGGYSCDVSHDEHGGR